jgi:hypothetical protein
MAHPKQTMFGKQPGRLSVFPKSRLMRIVDGKSRLRQLEMDEGYRRRGGIVSDLVRAYGEEKNPRITLNTGFTFLPMSLTHYNFMKNTEYRL